MTLNQLIEQPITCPYCSENFSVLVDGSESDQEYVEDCQVCCQPILITVYLPEEDVASLRLEVRREND
ncbi:MAG: hypothetical protein ACI9W6_002753 [Motiliproteus sp.]|jgi:hypothetical protein